LTYPFINLFLGGIVIGQQFLVFFLNRVVRIGHADYDAGRGCHQVAGGHDRVRG
jgi:hypothetical protein